MNKLVTYTVAAVVLICFVVAAIVALIISGRPETQTTPAITTIIGLAGPTLAVLVLLIRQENTADVVKGINDKVDNHIDIHNGPTL